MTVHPQARGEEGRHLVLPVLPLASGRVVTAAKAQSAELEVEIAKDGGGNPAYKTAVDALRVASVSGE